MTGWRTQPIPRRFKRSKRICAAPEQSVALAWLAKLGETTKRWEQLAESGAISWWLDKSDIPDVLPPPEEISNRVAPDASSSQQVIDDFVKREVLRLLNQIENPSALLGRKELRWLRDNVVEEARVANLLATAEDNRSLHTALARSIRHVRQENARVTSNSALVKAEQKKAQDLLMLLSAQDRVLANLLADEEFAHVALWYQLAEDAALSDDEVAALWEEDTKVVRAALVNARSVLLVEHQRDS